MNFFFQKKEFSKKTIMHVVKRNGQSERVMFDKITTRISRLCDGLNMDYIDPAEITLTVMKGLYNHIPTTELDNLAAETAAYKSTQHPDFGLLAARIAVSNLHKETKDQFSDVVEELYKYKNPLVSKELYTVVMANKDVINQTIIKERDYLFSYFGFKTLERSYLMKIDGRTVERPGYMFMRVALGIHGNDLESAIETYDLMSQKYFTHATPTLFNAGTKHNALASCYLIDMEADSVEGLYNTLKTCALISKNAGGIGVNIHKIRAKDSYIAGTNGYSNGIVPMLKVYNDTARYIDQCFASWTTVYTQAGPKKIQDITIADKVLSSNGKYNYVKNLLRHDYKGEVVRIHLKQAFEPVTVTPVHPVLALKNQAKILNFSTIKNRLEKKYATVEYTNVKDLAVGDFLVFPIPSNDTIVDLPHITEEDCRFYGIMIGDGHITKNNKEAGLCCGYEKKSDTLQFVKNYLNARMIHFWSGRDEIKHTESMKWSVNNPKFLFSKNQLYDDKYEKKIDPSFINLPSGKLLQLIKGIIETDGHLGKKEILLEMTSKNIIESVRYILMRLGMLSSGNIKNRIGNVSSYKNITSRKLTYTLRIPKHPMFETTINSSDKFSWFEYDNYLYSRIDKIEKDYYEGTLYDFEIDQDPSYVTHIGIAHNGGNKRPGAFAIYLEPWHADIFDFLDLKKNTGKEENRARDLFYGLWIPDLFMKRVEADGMWSLMCPNECPGLDDVWGDAFNELYERYEREGRARKTIKAQKLWKAITESQTETGGPYMLYKDSINRKTNHQNLGTIKSSNLCVAPETLLLTKENGEVPIASLEGKEVHVWNGQQWSKTKVIKTNDNAELMRVTLNNKKFLDCTFYHKFYLSSGEIVCASELCVGDSLEKSYDYEVNNPKVLKVEKLNRFSETFCLNEPLRHRAIFNGILTGNCCEITEYTSPNEVAVCNLASIALPMFISNNTFDFAKLAAITKRVTKNLNKVIDVTYYPVEQARRSNLKHRPIGLGVQGLADAFILLRMPFESVEARDLNKKIFETIYYAALDASCELAEKEGPYTSYEGSPVSKGILQYDMWGVAPSNLWDWDSLKRRIALHGVRNSLLVAPMPTASTSQILGNTEGIDPMTSNIYSRRVLAGNFIVVNQHLIDDLIKLGLWNEEMRQTIIRNKGSVQAIMDIPLHIRSLYKTVWEISQKAVIDLAADRGVYIDQSQSMNIHISEPTYEKLTSMHFYGWKKGLKTGSYYIRSQSATDPLQFTIDVKNKKEEEEVAPMCRKEAGCIVCSA